MDRPRLIPYYGGKAQHVHRYPKPLHATICEPFAGGASYSLAYADRRVVLIEKNPQLVALWRWVIRVTPAEIMALPLVECVDDLGPVPEEARWLVGWWMNTATTSPRRRLSQWGRLGLRPRQYWGEARRALLADVVGKIKHWHVFERDWAGLPNDPNVTWFVDPPYQHAGRHYAFGSAQIDYPKLGEWCQTRAGQVIACENAGANWLPFRPLVSAKSAARHTSTNYEVTWP